jgi:hypothetical protein
MPNAALLAINVRLAADRCCWADLKEEIVTPGATHEAAIVAAFIVKAKQTRFLEFLPDPRRRGDVLATFTTHHPDLDLRFAAKIPGHQQNPDAIANLLRERGAPERCYVISADVGIDGLFLPLAETLLKVVGSSKGTLLSCIPGRLAYFEGHEYGARYVLERRGSPTRS